MQFIQSIQSEFPNRTMRLNHLHSDILRYILTHNLQPGDRLPPLTELSASAGVSVGKLREQLEVARALGMVTVKPGAGIQVNPFDFAAAIQPGLLYAVARSDQHFEAYKALRNGVATAFWVEAVSRLTPDDIAALRELVAAAWERLNSPKIGIPHAEHRAFHVAIFRRLDNPFVVGIEEAYWEAYEAVELNRYTDYKYLTRVWEHHQRMVDCIARGEFEAAREVFVEHTRLLKTRPQA
ncbi:MAG: FadR family transcriptional regulator [Caldilineae bacterium]|nr:MAG: FadR family transcriptional regulator [Caldilineae bacterium]